jgi:ubiquinone/menaquinone biosynthesis C-methylase UbiE
MGFYRDHVVPHLVDWTCGTSGLDKWRARTCEGLSGTVVEIGFGTGHNVSHYPSAVGLVLAVEPSDRSMRLAEARISASRVPIRHAGIDGQTLTLADNSCDAALVTFALCTIPNPALALKELLRVLRPGGELHFLEHGRAPDDAVARWQVRIEPWERRLADGCHLTRDPTSMITDAGFEMIRCAQRYAKGPKPWSYFSAGVARKPTLERG